MGCGEFDRDLAALQRALPEWLCVLEPSRYNIEVTLSLPSGPRSFCVRLPDGFRDQYPRAEAGVSIDGDYEDLPSAPLADMLRSLYDKARRREAARPSGGGNDADDVDDDECMDDYADDDDDGDDDRDTLMEQATDSYDMDVPDESDMPLNLDFLTDVRGARRAHGEHIIAYEESKMLDHVVATIRIDISFLDGSVCNAWGLAPKQDGRPLCIRFTFSRTGYMDASTAVKVECFQEGRQWCGLAGQMKQIMKVYTEGVCKEVKRTGRPALWSSSPSSPPTAQKAGRSPVSPAEPAARRPAPRGSAAAPAPARASRQSGASDLPPGGKAALIELCCMGFTEDMARAALELTAGEVSASALLLTESPQLVAERVSEAEHSRARSGSRASSSGGAAAPPRRGRGGAAAAAPLQQELSRRSVDDKRAVPESPHGFLAQAVSYARHRIPTCCEFCVICDKPHVFASGAMLKASVCSRDLCGFAFQQLGVGADSATDIATEAGVVDLLLVMAKMAASSPRWDLIFSPYPTVFDPSNPERKVVDPERKDIEFVKKIFQAFPKIRDLNQTEDAIDMKKRMDTSNPWAHPLLTWIINSNLSHLIKMRDDGDTKRTVAAMRTPHQYLLLSAAPEKQKIFDAMKAKSKTMFAFHGSSIENWHSILRNGLYNASGTKHQVNGAAHGAGIYLSPDSQVSFGYSNLGTARSSRGGDGGAHGERYIEEGTDMRCVAICEVCEQDLRKSGQIWVQPNADYVVTRFLFVYDRHHKPERCPTTEDKEFISQLEQVIAHYAV